MKRVDENDIVLDLSNLSKEDITEILNAAPNPNITSVVFDVTSPNHPLIGEFEDIALEHILLFVQNNENIKSITVKLMCGGFVGFVEGLNKHQHLENLTLKENWTTFLKLDLIKAPNLKTLDLEFNNSPCSEPFQLLCLNNKNLTSLTLNKELSQQEINIIKKLFPQLKLTCNLINSPLVKKDETKLNLLEMSDEYINNNIDIIIENAFNPKISSISMNNCFMPRSDLALSTFIIKMYQNGYNQVRSIEFNDVRCLQNTMKNFIIKVGDFNSVQELSIINCGLSLSSLTCLASKSLIKLDCSNNYSLNGTCGTFKTIFFQNPNLKFLTWFENGVDEPMSTIQFMKESSICIKLDSTQCGFNAKNSTNQPYNSVYIPLYTKNFLSCAKEFYIKDHMKAYVTFLLCIKRIDAIANIKTPKVITTKIIDDLYEAVRGSDEEALKTDPVYIYYQQNLAGEEGAFDLN